jgi:hypothetical protein
MGHGRMHIQRHIQGLRSLKDGPEPLVVEEHAVGQAVDHGALEPQRGDRPLELVGCGLGVGCRQGREPGESVGMRGDWLGNAMVIDFTGFTTRCYLQTLGID